MLAGDEIGRMQDSDWHESERVQGEGTGSGWGHSVHTLALGPQLAECLC